MKDRDDNFIGKYYTDVWHFIHDNCLPYFYKGRKMYRYKKWSRHHRVFIIDFPSYVGVISVTYYNNKNEDTIWIKKTECGEKTCWVIINKNGIYKRSLKVNRKGKHQYYSKMPFYSHTNRFLTTNIKGFMHNPELVFNKILKDINLLKRPGIEWSYEPKVYQELIKHKNPYVFIDKHNKDFQKKNKEEIFNIVKQHNIQNNLLTPQ